MMDYFHLIDSGQPEHNWEKYYTLKQGDIFVEGGAFWGRYVIIASEKVGPQGRVIAIEPSPVNIATLEKLIERRGLKNVTLVRKALWSKRGRETFCVDGNPAGHKLTPSGVNLIEVEVDAIDNILEELGITVVNLLAADVEGAEAEILRGAERSLTTKKIQNLAIAAYHLGSYQQVQVQIIDFLTSKGYQGIKYEEGVAFARARITHKGGMV